MTVAYDIGTPGSGVWFASRSPGWLSGTVSAFDFGWSEKKGYFCRLEYQTVQTFIFIFMW